MKIIRFLPLLVCLVLFGLFGFTLVVGNAQDQSPLVDQPLPEFFVSTTDQSGTLLTNKTIKKPALLVFWASWCGICKVSMPYVGAFAKEHNIPVYGIAYHDEARSLLNALNGFGNEISFAATGMDFDGSVSSQFGITGVPTLFVIDKNGIVRAMRAGQTDERDLDDLLKFLG